LAKKANHSKPRTRKAPLKPTRAGKKLDELLRVYEDLEHTLKALTHAAERRAESSLKQINVKKLVSQLSHSKKKIERKLGSRFQIKKLSFKTRWDRLTSQLTHREP
jgi:hypothetical protein